MEPYIQSQNQKIKSFKGILKDTLIFIAFFPAMKCLVSLFDIVTSQHFPENGNIFDYSIQIMGLFYFIYYVSKNMKKNKKDKT